ncbi:MAG: hypothetical protein QOD99_2349 [Chthoniobacter sp.]|jgi:hypothetical protein|nr:hypothetical protein [Chthoniobacter sp.]
MKSRFSALAYCLWAIWPISGALADTKGVLFYSDFGTMAPEAVEFEAISWKSGAEALVKRPGRQPELFSE